MKTTKTPVKITVSRKGAEVMFELDTEDGIDFLFDHLPVEVLMLAPEQIFDTLDENVGMFHGTDDRDFLRKVRAIIDDAINQPREGDTLWVKIRRVFGAL